MTRLASSLAAAALALATLTGCSPPRTLVDQSYAGSKVLRVTIAPSKRPGSTSHDTFLVACTQKPDGSVTDCKETMLVGDVQPAPLHP